MVSSESLVKTRLITDLSVLPIAPRKGEDGALFRKASVELQKQ
jgi:hypothetical protein